MCLRNGGEEEGGSSCRLMMIRPESQQTAEALKTCQDVQHIIDITSQHLDRLRSVRAVGRGQYVIGTGTFSELYLYTR